MVVVELLHETNLCFLLNWLVSRTVFTNAERIVGPDELNWKFHEGCHTNCWLHVVAEYEECTACWDNTSVKCHTDAAACHSEFGNTCLKECS